MDVLMIDEHCLDAQNLMSEYNPSSPLNSILTDPCLTGSYNFILPQHQHPSAAGNALHIEQTDSTNLLEAPAPGRKPKARTLRERDWEPVKNRVLELLGTKTLAEVRATVMEETGFAATERQYKSILRKWNVGKNIRKEEMKAIVRKRQHRLIREPAKPGYIFELRGQPVHEEKIERFMKRYDIPSNEVYSPVSGAPTPDGDIVECWTPEPIWSDSLPSSLPLRLIMGRAQVMEDHQPSGELPPDITLVLICAYEQLKLSLENTILDLEYPPSNISRQPTSVKSLIAKNFELHGELELSIGMMAESVEKHETILMTLGSTWCQLHHDKCHYSRCPMTKLLEEAIAPLKQSCVNLYQNVAWLSAVVGLHTITQHHCSPESLNKASHIRQLIAKLNDECTIDLYMHMGLLLAASGDMEEAVCLLRPLETTAVRQLRHTHVTTLTIRTVLRHVLIDMGNYREAEQIQEAV